MPPLPRRRLFKPIDLFVPAVRWSSSAASMRKRYSTHRATSYHYGGGASTCYCAMHAHPSRPSRDLSSLRLCRYAMAPMPKTLLLKLLDGVSFVPILTSASGQTGSIPSATIFETDQQRQRFGGRIGVLARLSTMWRYGGGTVASWSLVNWRNRVPWANVMLGYYKDPEATAYVQRFGWHHTGDLGTFDEDGQLLFMDRLKDMIKSGGENVPSIKVEEVLLRHPAVQNAAVVGLPHERWGEAITAFVTVKPGTETSAVELIAHCKGHLGRFEVPKMLSFLLHCR